MTITIVGPGIPDDFNQTPEIAKSLAEIPTEVEINHTQEQRAEANAIATRIVSLAIADLIREQGSGLTFQAQGAVRRAAYAEIIKLIEPSAQHQSPCTGEGSTTA